MIPQRITKELNAILGPEARVSLVSDRGLSSAVVYRVETLTNWYALKRWPLLVDRKHLAEIHRFQQFLAETGKTQTPKLLRWIDGETGLEADSVVWELAEWKSGHPLEKLGQVTEAQLIECVSVLAVMHEQSRLYGASVGQASGLQQRNEKLLRCVANPSPSIHQFLNSISVHGHYAAASLLSDIALRSMRIAPTLLGSMERLSSKSVPRFWVLRDVWRDHILYRGDQVTGILDFGAARIDWPGFDLVRALGTLMLDSDPRWSLALAQYVQLQPDSAIDIDSIKQVHRASVVLSALQWLEWFASGQFDWRNSHARSWQRVIEIHQQLEDIEKGLAITGLENP